MHPLSGRRSGDRRKKWRVTLRQPPYACYDYKPKEDTLPYRDNRAVPWVQLKGYWLEQTGFNIDTPIQARVMNGCLVLPVVTEQE